MQISDSSGKTGIVEDIDFICGTDSTSFALADKIRLVNRHYYKAVIDVIKSQGRLQWDDSNLTTLPEYTFDLVAGQADYSLPTNLLKLWAIEVKDNGGNWYRLKEIDIQDPQMARTISSYQSTSGTPREYEIRGDSVRLLPPAASGSVTLTAGGKMLFSRELDLFTTADTTQEPGIAEPFHRILSLGAAYDWLLINDTQAKADRVLQQYEQLRAELRSFYAHKNLDVEERLVPSHNVNDYL